VKIRRRTNLLWGVVLLAVAIVYLLRALSLLPEGIYDVIVRAWPILLVLGGLSILLRDRIPLGGFIALVLSGILAAGVVTYGFSNRALQPRSDYQQAVNEAIAEGVTLLRIRIESLATDVELRSSTRDNRAVTGEFVGSSESNVLVEYRQDDAASATLTVREEPRSKFPMLAAVGRGRLELELPTEIPLDVQFTGVDGNATLNMDGLLLERMNIDLKKGDALVTLPEYDPALSEDTAVLGTLEAESGSMTIFVPDAVAARLALSANSITSPQYNPSIYNLLAGDNTTPGGVLEARAFDSAEIKMRYVVTVPRGQVRLEVAS